MIKIYDAPRSGHCHRVRLAARLMGIPFELISVADMPGGREGAAYLAINPFHQIPAIDDGGVIIRDSIAILIYLADTYDRSGRWYPRDPQTRVRVNEWFGTAAGHLFRGPNLARLIKVFNMPGDHAAAVAVANQLFTVMNAHLAGRTWLVGDGPTLADVACYSYIRLADEGEVDVAPYENIVAWLSATEGLENFLPVARG